MITKPSSQSKNDVYFGRSNIHKLLAVVQNANQLNHITSHMHLHMSPNFMYVCMHFMYDNI
jgi:hypothetical protein